MLNQHLLRQKKLTKLTRQRIEKNTVKSSIICPEINKKEFTTGLSMYLVQIKDLASIFGNVSQSEKLFDIYV